MTGELFSIMPPGGSGSAQATPALSDRDLRHLYRTMLLVRRIDERAMKLQRQGRIAAYLVSTGQEASHVGSAFALDPSDWIFPAYRELGAALVRGFSLHHLFCQLFGNAADLQKGHQMPIHWGHRGLNLVTSSSPLGTQLPMAVGVAFAARFRGDPVISLAYFGDGATSTSDFHAAMNLAGVWKTPTIFFCANNRYAISLPVHQQTAAETLAVKAVAYGMPGVRVDGTDVLAVYAATKAAADKARAGGGPTLIEAVAERIGGHTSADDPTRYRDADELEAARARDPIVRFRSYLAAKGVWNPAFEESCIADIDAEIAAAIAAVETIGRPDVATLFEDVYASLPAHLADQLAEARLDAGAVAASTGRPHAAMSVMDEEDAGHQGESR